MNNNEAQFRLLANKFNESVEVILELSEKVNKLEKSIYYKKEIKLSRGLPFLFNFRLILIIFIVFILGYNFSLIDIDTTLIREIIKDLLTGI